MDVLIKNMKLPKSCSRCDLCFFCSDERHFCCTRLIGQIFDIELSEQRQEGCPLVEIPPHGPLADLNKIKDKFRTASKMCEATNKLERAKHWRDAEGLVNESEVILESTEEVEENT